MGKYFKKKSTGNYGHESTIYFVANPPKSILERLREARALLKNK